MREWSTRGGGKWWNPTAGGPRSRYATRASHVQSSVCKTHVSLNAETGIVTSLVPSRGNQADNKVFPDLLAHDQALQLPTTTYGGDRAYDDTDIYERLEVAGLHSGIYRH